MRAVARALAIACLLGLPAGGCEDPSLTQLVVVIDGDWDGFELIEIEIEDFGDGRPVRAEDLTDKPLPRRVALVHDGGPLGPFAITVRAYALGMDLEEYGIHGRQPVVRIISILDQAKGDSLTLTIARQTVTKKTTCAMRPIIPRPKNEA